MKADSTERMCNEIRKIKQFKMSSSATYYKSQAIAETQEFFYLPHSNLQIRIAFLYLIPDCHFGIMTAETNFAII
jgi:hypothetical protein